MCRQMDTHHSYVSPDFFSRDDYNTDGVRVNAPPPPKIKKKKKKTQ